jgi:hypothetical protein
MCINKYDQHFFFQNNKKLFCKYIYLNNLLEKKLIHLFEIFQVFYNLRNIPKLELHYKYKSDTLVNSL